MKIFVTGAMGMLGTDVVGVLKESSHVLALDLADGDLARREWIGDVIRGFKPDWVVNCAAYTNVEGAEDDEKGAYRGNVTIPENLALVCDRENAGLVHISTDYVFDGKQPRPYREGDPAKPVSVYGRTKLEGEKKAAQAKKYFILRTSWLYGQRGVCFPKKIIAKIKEGQQLSVVDDQTGTPSSTKDCARLIRDLIARDPKEYGLYHINNSGSVTWFGFACHLRDCLKVPCKITGVKTADFPSKAMRPLFSVLDNSKIEKILGYKPRPWQEAFDEFIKEYSEKIK